MAHEEMIRAFFEITQYDGRFNAAAEQCVTQVQDALKKGGKEPSDRSARELYLATRKQIETHYVEYFAKRFSDAELAKLQQLLLSPLYMKFYHLLVSADIKLDHLLQEIASAALEEPNATSTTDHVTRH